MLFAKFIPRTSISRLAAVYPSAVQASLSSAFIHSSSSMALSMSDNTNIAGTSAEVEAVTDLSKLEIRVGRIVEIAKHPEAEALYVEKVNA